MVSSRFVSINKALSFPIRWRTLKKMVLCSVLTLVCLQQNIRSQGRVCTYLDAGIQKKLPSIRTGGQVLAALPPRAIMQYYCSRMSESGYWSLHSFGRAYNSVDLPATAPVTSVLAQNRCEQPAVAGCRYGASISGWHVSLLQQVLLKLKR